MATFIILTGHRTASLLFGNPHNIRQWYSLDIGLPVYCLSSNLNSISWKLAWCNHITWKRKNIRIVETKWPNNNIRSKVMIHCIREEEIHSQTFYTFLDYNLSHQLWHKTKSTQLNSMSHKETFNILAVTREARVKGKTLIKSRKLEVG